jgi:hypothetical protein
MKFDTGVFFQNLLRKFKLYYNQANNNVYFKWGHIHIYIYSRGWIILRMRRVSHQSCIENQNTHSALDNFFCLGKSRCLWDITRIAYLLPRSRVLLNETMWTNTTVVPGTPHMTKRRIHFACRMTKARIRKHKHIHTNIYNLFLFHCISGYASALQYYVIRTLPIFFKHISKFDSPRVIRW